MSTNTLQVTIRTPNGRRQLGAHEIPSAANLASQKYWNDQCIISVARTVDRGRHIPNGPSHELRTAWTAANAAQLLADLIAAEEQEAARKAEEAEAARKAAETPAVQIEAVGN
jgi:hypothetical protein